MISAGTLNVGANAPIGGGGTFDVAGTINNAGLIVADGSKPGLGLGPVVVNATSVVGTGVFEVAGPSTLELNAATAENIVVDPSCDRDRPIGQPHHLQGWAFPRCRRPTEPDPEGTHPTGATISTADQTLTITGAAGTLETIPFVSDTGDRDDTGNDDCRLRRVSLTAAAAPRTRHHPLRHRPSGPPHRTPPTVTPPPVAGTSNAAGSGDSSRRLRHHHRPAHGRGRRSLSRACRRPPDQYINITSDNLNITASTPNWFIHSGSGDDAIAVNSGTNVLDGGTGSNFLTGGSGTDTFFVDDRGATADIWSTVVGFHSGDAATVWGVTPQDFALDWVDGQGAAGFTGLTLHATAAGKPTASLTLAGYTQADMSSGRLSVQFGTDPASGSAFMFMHGNS